MRVENVAGCHAGCQEVTRCHTRGESEDHSSEKACKGSTLALKPRADVTRSPNRGTSGPTKKTCVLYKNVFKKCISVSIDE